MLGNAIILVMTAGLFYFVVKVFNSELKYKPIYHVTALFSALALIFMIIIPNIDFISRPITPSIHGKLIDAETKQPITNAKILVTSFYERSVFMSLKTVVTNQYILTSNKDGEFNIGMRLRYLSFHFPCSYVPLLTRQSGDRYITIWKKGYKSGYTTSDNMYLMSKIVSIKDKKNELHNMEERLDRANRLYFKNIRNEIEIYVKELKRETPVDSTKPYWLMEN